MGALAGGALAGGALAGGALGAIVGRGGVRCSCSRRNTGGAADAVAQSSCGAAGILISALGASAIVVVGFVLRSIAGSMGWIAASSMRSEEHTSELQSLRHL